MIKLSDEKMHEIAMRAHATCLRIGGSHYNAAQMAIEEVQRLNATAQPVSDGWVKCSDRMPEDGKEVLCAYKGSGQGVHIWYGQHWDEGDFNSSIFGNLITHWMPLPAAPGGQDD